jgi:multidrug efflux pump subunit AcrB
MNSRFNTPRWLKNFYNFYRDGFKNMTLGWTLWAVVLIKLFIMFAILKVFFFPNFLNSKFESEEEKAGFVKTELIDRSTANTTDSLQNQ